MGLSRTVSVENRKIFPHRVFCTPADGLPFGIRYRLPESKTRMMGLSDGQKSFKMGLAV